MEDITLTVEQRQAKEISMRVVKAAAVQLSPVLYSREGTVEKVVRKIHELGQQGVQFATFPETVVPYYPYFSFIQSPYQIIVGPEHRKLLDQAVIRDLLALARRVEQVIGQVPRPTGFLSFSPVTAAAIRKETTKEKETKMKNLRDQCTVLIPSLACCRQRCARSSKAH